MIYLLQNGSNGHLHAAFAVKHVGIAIRIIVQIEIIKSAFNMIFKFSYQAWYDGQLTWDPAQYNNRTYMVLQPDDIWLPKLSIFHRYDRKDFL